MRTSVKSQLETQVAAVEKGKAFKNFAKLCEAVEETEWAEKHGYDSVQIGHMIFEHDVETVTPLPDPDDLEDTPRRSVRPKGPPPKAEKRGRGRPRKVEVEPEPEPVAKRPKGRPRKIQVDLDDDKLIPVAVVQPVVNPPSPPVIVEVPKRGRGRPRKVTTEAEAVEAIKVETPSNERLLEIAKTSSPPPTYTKAMSKADDVWAKTEAPKSQPQAMQPQKMELPPLEYCPTCSYTKIPNSPIYRGFGWCEVCQPGITERLAKIAQEQQPWVSNGQTEEKPSQASVTAEVSGTAA